MRFSVRFQESGRSPLFKGNDTFEFLDGGVLKVTSDVDVHGSLRQTAYYAPGVWQDVETDFFRSAAESTPIRAVLQTIAGKLKSNFG